MQMAQIGPKIFARISSELLVAQNEQKFGAANNNCDELRESWRYDGLDNEQQIGQKDSLKADAHQANGMSEKLLQEVKLAIGVSEMSISQMSEGMHGGWNQEHISERSQLASSEAPDKEIDEQLAISQEERKGEKIKVVNRQDEPVVIEYDPRYLDEKKE